MDSQEDPLNQGRDGSKSWMRIRTGQLPGPCIHSHSNTDLLKASGCGAGLTQWWCFFSLRELGKELGTVIIAQQPLLTELSARRWALP